MKIIVDTDIGSNIDDSLALFYLLKKCPQQILAVSTVSSQAFLRSELAKLMIRSLSLDIPVLSGMEESLDGKVMENQFSLIANLINLQKISTKKKLSQPWNLYKKMTELYPGEINLIAIGPLTNVARFIQEYPKSCAKLKSIRIMAGKFADIPGYLRSTETNAASDPVGLKIVLDKAECEVFMTPVNITYATTVNPDFLEMAPESEGISILKKQLASFLTKGRPLILHDPVVAASLFSDFLEYSNGFIDVNTSGEAELGSTTFLPDKKMNKRFIAKSMNLNKFFDEFKNVLFS